ncbi:MAG: peptide deformylase [Verrucomicrobia bacterium]|nr:peptide deformylase [Pseudomonadota bacterium]NBS06658.1 peptide deformylase [Verrucomicrobiota bacterium]NBS79108.1 peptide deformylase [bacterium]NBS50456.1 peptide deformylase [Verrucomicrobiota bacterium]NBT23718.1 peptide deformylase [bacterium]
MKSSSPVLPVRLYGDPVLRQIAAPVAPPDKKLTEFSRVLENTMREAEGIGLAAPQVGISLQIAVVDLRKVEKRPSTMELMGKPVDWRVHMPLFFCNPVLSLTRRREDEEEGCLSFPGLLGPVRRSLRVQMDYLDLEGRPLSLTAGGLLARALQHEVDHLMGTLFIDRMTPEARRTLNPALEEILQKQSAGK